MVDVGLYGVMFVAWALLVGYHPAFNWTVTMGVVAVSTLELWLQSRAGVGSQEEEEESEGLEDEEGEFLPFGLDGLPRACVWWCSLGTVVLVFFLESLVVHGISIHGPRSGVTSTVSPELCRRVCHPSLLVRDPVFDWMKSTQGVSSLVAAVPAIDALEAVSVLLVLLVLMPWIRRDACDVHSRGRFMRVCYLYACGRFLRTLCFSVTVLPSPDAYCTVLKGYDKETASALDMVLGHVGQLDRGGCHDLVFSGHTFSLTVAICTCIEFGLPWTSFTLASLALPTCFSMILSRSHYTVDVVVAIYTAFFLFVATNRKGNWTCRRPWRRR